MDIEKKVGTLAILLLICFDALISTHVGYLVGIVSRSIPNGMAAAGATFVGIMTVAGVIALLWMINSPASPRNRRTPR